MKQVGMIVLFQFPNTSLKAGKLRPALRLGRIPGDYDDWLICMVSSQLQHYTPNFDEIIGEADPDFAASGLKETSLIRIGRLALVEGDVILGAIGHILQERLHRIRGNLVRWLQEPAD